jgi:hypothetical protein
MNKNNLKRILDCTILSLAVIYFVGFLALYPDSIFLSESLYHIPYEYEIYFEYVLWILFSLLVLDLFVKYKQLKNWRTFLKKHWHDIAMLALIPFLAVFKIVKIAIKMVKTLKASKSGFKVFYKAKKASKY